MNNYIELKYIEVKQPIGTFYITKIGWKDLIEIAEADIRKIEEENKRSDTIDSYLGIQREVSKNRVKEIGSYVKTSDATFPTSIILSIASISYLVGTEEVNKINYENLDAEIQYKEIENVKFEDGKMYIRKSKAIANILDGQHRIEGLKAGFVADDLFDVDCEFELNVTVFVDIDIDDQAQIFSVINKAQTKVNKSLVYDLYEYANTRSPQKTGHDIVRLLNKREDSPFYKKVKILGKAVDTDLETIAQATLVELIINYLSKDPMKDRDLLRRKKAVRNDLDSQRYIFRDLFVDEKDELILLVIYNYFSAIKKKWRQAWDNSGRGNILNKSTGIIALFRLLKDVYNHLDRNPKTTIDRYFILLDRVELQDNAFNPKEYIPGSSGQSLLYKELKTQMGI